MLIDLNGKIAIVTGAAHGIGAELCERFAREGVTVCRWDDHWPYDVIVDPDKATVDVTDSASVQGAIAGVMARHGRVDILVNNAGIATDETVESMAEQHWRSIIDTNLTGVFLVSKAVIPAMKEQNSGRILNAASFAAMMPAYGGAAYGSSKSGVVYFTRVLAGELEPWNITVNAYASGTVPQEPNDLLDTLMLRHVQTSDDVANLVCFLASEQASYITGTLIDVSGGKLATQRPYV